METEQLDLLLNLGPTHIALCFDTYTHLHFLQLPVSTVKQSPPPRKAKHRPLPRADSDSQLKDSLKQDKDTTSIGSTLPCSPTSSTCVSSQSIQSVRDETVLDEEEVYNYDCVCQNCYVAHTTLNLSIN